MGIGVAYIKVELQLPVTGWTDITNYIRVSKGITITHGRADEASVASPGKCVFTVDNSDGRFSTAYPYGAWYGEMARNLAVRVSSEHPSGVSPLKRFYGYIDSLPMSWDQSAHDHTVTISCSTISRRLSKTNQTVSALKGHILSTVAAGSVRASWPLEGANTAIKYPASYTSVGAPSPMVQIGGGTITPNAYTGFEGSEGLPTLASTAGLMARLPSSQASDGHSYWAAVTFPAAGTITDQSSILEARYGNGTIRTVGIRYRAGGGLSFYALDTTGTDLIADTNHLWGLDGKRAIVYFGVLFTSGVGVDWTMRAITIDTDGLPTTNTTTGSVAQNMFTSGSLWVAKNGLPGVSIGHVTFGIYASTLATNAAQAAVGYPGERADARILRLAGNLGTTLSTSVLEESEAMGPQATANPMAAIKEAAAADGGIFCDLPSGAGFWFMSQLNITRVHQTAALTLDVDSGHLAAPPDPTLDDQYLCTAATVTKSRGGGGQSYAITSTEAVPLTQSLNLWGEPRCLTAAEFMVHAGTFTSTRIPTLQIDLRKNTSLIPAWLLLAPGALVVVRNPPDHLSMLDLNFVAQGWTEYVDDFTWKATLTVTPADVYYWGMFGASKSYRLDTDGATVSSLRTATTTTVPIATTSAYKPLLSTAAADYNDASHPCLVIASTGEVMRITAVSGASSPQTATVVRSVNGVVNTLPAGATIRLYQPFRWAR